MSKNCRFTVPFNKQHGKRARTLFKSERWRLCHVYWSLQRQLSLKKSLLLICKILRLFLHTFPADDKYSLPNRDNLTQSVQMQFSQKQNPFSPFFDKVFKFRLNIEHIQKKMTLTANVFPKLRTSKYVVWSISKKYLFRVPLDKQHGRRA